MRGTARIGGRRGARPSFGGALSLAFALAAAADTARAQPVAPPLAAPRRATTVEGVTVTVHPHDPKVVASFPADGASVPFGTLVIKLVFDQAMTPEAWSYGRTGAAALPDCLARPRLLPDQRTVVLLCSLSGGRAFGLEVNAAPDFVSRGGRAAKPYLLRFSTTTEAVAGVHEALAQAGLTDADNPIMDWNGAAGVASHAAPPRDPPALP